MQTGLTREYFLSLDFTGTLSSSDTFQVELTRDSVKAKGRSSFVGFKPGTGPAAIQGGKVIGGVGNLTLAEGTNNNRDTIAFTNQGYISSGINFTLQASSVEDVMIDTMKIALKKGEYTKISMARLFRDMNGNHKLDTLADYPIATASSFTAANMAIFSSVMPMGHMDTVAAGLTREYFLSLDFTGTLSSSDTFQVELTRDSIKAKGRSSFVGFKPGTGPAAIQGGKVTGGMGGLTFNVGTTNGHDTIAFTNQGYINSGLHFTLAASSVEDVMVDTMKVALIKGNYIKIAQTRLFRDMNGNQKLDTLADYLMSTTSFTGGNPAVFYNTMPFSRLDTIASGQTRNYFVALDFGATALNTSDTFIVELKRDSIRAKGRSSMAAFAPGTGSTSIQGGKVIGGMGSLNFGAGTTNGRDTIALTNQGYVNSGLHFTLAASSIEDVMIDTMKVALIKGNYIKINQARLFRDMNGNQKLDTLADYQMAIASFTGGNPAVFYNTMPFSRLDTIASSQTRNYFVALDFGATQLNNSDTFMVELKRDSIRAKGRSSMVAFSPSTGSPAIQGGKVFGFAPMYGEYRSNISNGNWTSLSSWERYNDTTWSMPSAGAGYPGKYSLPPLVTIRSGHTITLDSTPAYHIGKLAITGSTATNLTMSTYSLIVDDSIKIIHNGTSGNVELNVNRRHAYMRQYKDRGIRKRQL